jgi:hypothetical protein
LRGLDGGHHDRIKARAEEIMTALQREWETNQNPDRP